MSAPKPTDGSRQELRALVERFRRHEAFYTRSSSNYNEHSCRDEFINPFLKLLGWDVENEQGLPPQYREVIAENPSSESEFPDYTLTFAGTPKFFLEAKKPSVNINALKGPAEQTRRYGWNKGHLIAALSNFESLILYDATVMPLHDDEPYVACYRSWHCSEYEQNFDEIYALLSKESVYSGHFEIYFSGELQGPDAAKHSAKRRVNEVFLQQVNRWRLSIAQALIGNDERFMDQALLNDATQDLINQIVFLRICEDRGLPTPRCLRDLPRENTNKELGELLDRVDRRFNSGLFHQRLALENCGSQAIERIIDELYYPKSPFLFDIIDPSIFGQIYEMYLAEQVVLTSDGPVIAKKREYEKRSVVSTPAAIAKHIVDAALSPICDGKEPDDIKNLRVADIACGSGIFLIEVFQYLSGRLLSWYYDNDRRHLIPCENGGYKLPLSEKKEILNSCLFGLDIDANAVEVAKLSLLIKLIEEETASSVTEENPVLPNLDETIMTGNALLGPGEISTHDLDMHTLSTVAPFDWGDEVGGLRFDAIVGNPPYVQTKDMKNLLPECEFQAYKEGYQSAYKQFDKYYLFIERSLSLLKRDGRACLIVPNKFYKIAAGKELRSLLARRRCVSSIENFGAAQLFLEKTIYSAIICLSKAPCDTFAYLERDNAASACLDKQNGAVTLPCKQLGAKPWRLTTDLDFLEKLNEVEQIAVPIAKHVDFFNGIQTSAEAKRCYWFSTDEIVREDVQSYIFERYGFEWPIEKKILRRYFKPTKEHGYNSYSALSADKLIIFPYDNEGKLLSQDYLEEHCPGAWNFLLNQKDELWPKQLPGNGRRDVPEATEDTWYQYGRCQALSSFNGKPKIIVGVLSKAPLYYVDNEDWVIASGGTAGYCGARMKGGSPYSLEYIQAWLSSDCIEKYFSVVGSDFVGDCKSRGTSLLKDAPFVELDLSNAKQKELYDAVNLYSKRIADINGQLLAGVSRREEIVLKREKDALIKDVNDTITDIFYLRFN